MNNLLYKYIRARKYILKTLIANNLIIYYKLVKIILLIIFIINLNIRFSFYTYYFLILFVALSTIVIIILIYIDLEYLIILIDRVFLLK